MEEDLAQNLGMMLSEELIFSVASERCARVANIRTRHNAKVSMLAALDTARIIDRTNSPNKHFARHT